ncbi:MAG: hypothetical protein AAGF11_50995 [Myxococcota bacterium]
MTMENAPSNRAQSDLDLLWVALGRLALSGQVPLPVARWACATLVVVSSYRRHGKIKTYVAEELHTSRRVVRETLARWTEYHSIHPLIDDLRREMEPGTDR